MRIIHVTPSYPPCLGGMEQVVKEIAEHSARRGHKVTVLTSDVGCTCGVERKKNLAIHRLRSLTVAHTPVMPALFPRLMAMPQKSIIHVHVAQAFAPEVSALAALLKGIPYVAQLHADVLPSGKLGFILPLYKKALLGPVLKGANIVIVLTRDHKEFVSKEYGVDRKRIAVMPNGTSFPIVRVSREGIHKPVRLLSVGRLVKGKNIPLLVEALKMVRAQGIRAELHIVGDGPEKGRIIAKAHELQVTPFVHMHGRKDGKELLQLYRSSDIFLLASEREAYPLVIPEAMASGIPVIAGNIASVRRLIVHGETGLLSGLTSTGFCNAICTIILNRNIWHRLASKGLGRAARFGWEAIIDDYEKMYRGLSNEN